MWTTLVSTTVSLALALGLQVSTPEVGTEPTGTIEGVVTRMGTGEAVPRAVAELTPLFVDPVWNDVRPEPSSNVADSSGRFRFDGVAPGPYRVVVFRNGYVRQTAGSPEGSAVDVVEGETTVLSFEMVPAATVAGRVYDRANEPIAGAEVQILTERFTIQAGRALSAVRRATTDDRGEYRVYWLDPGDYFVSASIDARSGGVMTGGGANAEPVAGGRMIAFHPGVASEALAQPVSLRSGDQLSGVDLMLEPELHFTVSGRLVAAFPLDMVRLTSVMMMPFDAPSTSAFSRRTNPARTEEDGSFRIRNVTPGSYTVSSQVMVDGRRWAAEITVEVTNRDIENVTLVLNPGFEIPGRLFVEAALDDEASAISSDADLESMRPYLTSTRPNGLGSSLAEAVDPAGIFLLENVMAGRYNINVTVGQSRLFVKRILLDGAEVSPYAPVTLAGPPEGGLDILLSPNGGRVDGRATDADGNSVPGSQVVLFPVGPDIDLPRRLRSSIADLDGNFSLTAIPPGDYQLLAWQSIPRGQFYDTDFLARFRTRGERIRIEEASNATIDLQVIPVSETQ